MKLAVESLTSACAGEVENGDGVFCAIEGAVARFAVIDGLGHGPSAAKAANAALSTLADMAHQTSIERAFERLGDALRPTRGAAVLLAHFDDGFFECASVGNVALRQVGSTLPIVLSPGIVGARVPQLRVFNARLVVGTRLFAFTDGISTKFDHTDFKRLPGREACDSILTRYRRTRDDASVLIADVED